MDYFYFITSACNSSDYSDFSNDKNTKKHQTDYNLYDIKNIIKIGKGEKKIEESMKIERF